VEFLLKVGEKHREEGRRDGEEVGQREDRQTQFIEGGPSSLGWEHYN